MPFPWLALAITVGFTFLGQLLSRRPKKKDEGLEGFQVPTATEDRPKPLWVGTVRHKSANCIWYGDYSAKAIKNKVGLFGIIASFGAALLNKQIIGYKYYIGAQLCLGWGQVDAITRIRLNDKEAWSGSIASGEITIDKPELFGSEDEPQTNGGFQGKIVVYPGNGTQTADPYVVSKSGATPAYKSDVLMVFKGLTSGRAAYVGNSPSFPDITVDVQRFPNTLGVSGGKHIIDTYDANPVCALYEFMTREDNEYGGGFSSVQFNLTNWRAAAETVHGDGLGISRMFDQTGDVEAIINDYLELIDAVININMTTGLFEIVLARADYDADTIPALGENDVMEVTSYKRGSWSETFNEVKLSYIDRTKDFESVPIAAQDGANSSGQQEVRSTTASIQGLSNPTTANKVMWRELRVLSTPLATITLKVNRKAFNLYGGAVFKWIGTTYGVAGMVFRVTEVDSGILTSNEVIIKAVQDVFSLGATAYLPPEGTTWTNPATGAANITIARLMEQPYFFHADDTTKVFTVAHPANGAQLGYNLYTHQASDPYEARLTLMPYTPNGLLVAAYNSTAYNVASELIIASEFAMDDLPASVSSAEIAAGGGLIVIGDEILAYESYSVDGSGNFVFNGVWGGLLDTVLASHAIGDRAWFFSENMAPDQTSYTAGATVKAKLSSVGSDGSIPLASCTEFTL